CAATCMKKLCRHGQRTFGHTATSERHALDSLRARLPTGRVLRSKKLRAFTTMSLHMQQNHAKRRRLIRDTIFLSAPLYMASASFMNSFRAESTAERLAKSLCAL